MLRWSHGNSFVFFLITSCQQWMLTESLREKCFSNMKLIILFLCAWDSCLIWKIQPMKTSNVCCNQKKQKEHAWKEPHFLRWVAEECTRKKQGSSFRKLGWISVRSKKQRGDLDKKAWEVMLPSMCSHGSEAHTWRSKDNPHILVSAFPLFLRQGLIAAVCSRLMDPWGFWRLYCLCHPFPIGTLGLQGPCILASSLNMASTSIAQCCMFWHDKIKIQSPLDCMEVLDYFIQLL